MPDLQKDRRCGECTACCKTHAVPSIDKAPNVWCGDCAIGTGCKRYENRPAECREFSCAWLIGYGTDDEQPDKSKVVAGANLVEGLGDVLTIHEMRLGAFEKSRLAKEWRDRGTGMNSPIFILREQGRSELLIPERFVLTEELNKEFHESDVTVRRYSKVT